MTVRGPGRRPKDPSQRARTNVDTVPHHMLDLKSVPQPSLGTPPKWLGPWPEQTKKWWKTWGAAAQSQLFTQTDWDFLLDTALIHARVWTGDVRQAPELRIRVAKFGATSEDRLRLRLFAEKGDTEDEPGDGVKVSKPRYGEMRVVDGG